MKPFKSRPENEAMRTFLASHGITCKARFIWSGSVKGCWSLYGADQPWTIDLADKLNGLGFSDYDGKPLGQFSGNGGDFSILAMSEATDRFLTGVEPPKGATYSVRRAMPA